MSTLFVFANGYLFTVFLLLKITLFNTALITAMAKISHEIYIHTYIHTYMFICTKSTQNVSRITTNMQDRKVM